MKRTTNHFFAPSAKGLVGAMGRAALVLLCVLSAAGAWAQSTSSNFSVSGDTYTIQNAAGWDEFCNNVTNGDNFNGKTIVLARDITVTTMAGNKDKRFAGTFNGDGHKLTLHYGSPEAPVDAQFVAPFPAVTGNAKFSNLNIDGYIYSTYTGSEPGVGGLIGLLRCDGAENITIEHCTSTVKINSTTGSVGGFVGLCEHSVTFNDCRSSAVITSASGNNSGFVGWSRSSGYTISFYGCLFNGKVLKAGDNSQSNGGFIGWKGDDKYVTITNCVYDPAPRSTGEVYASYNSATFCRQHDNNRTAEITNCYYTQTFGAAQGNQARAISGGEHVTLANAGTPVVTYTTSGITSYGTGIEYNNVFYAGVDDEVSLTLSSDQPAEGYSFSGYNATPDGAALTGSDANGWTLTMPDADVTIGAVYTPITYDLDGGALPEGRANPESYTVESETFTLVNPVRDGYVFAGWTGGGLSEPSTKVTIATGSTTGDKTYTATWGLAYIDVDGTTKTCTNYTVLTGSEESSLAEGWYVAKGTVNFDHGFKPSGDIHLILMDDAVMRIGTEDSPVNGGIDTEYQVSISIHGQSTGERRGQLWINAWGNGIHAYCRNIEISGCEVHAKGSGNQSYGIFNNQGSLSMTNAVITAEGGDIGIYSVGEATLTNCKVTATGDSNGIAFYSRGGVIRGGQVTATGTNGYGILAEGSLTLSWNAPTDFIEANSYYAAEGGTITLAKPFTDGDGNIYSGVIDNEEDGTYAIDGKKLLPDNGPLNLTATNITETSATLTWQPRGDETQWLVSWSTDDGSTWSTPVTVNACSYELTGLSVNTTVRVKVQGILGEGLYSAPATCTFDTPLTYLDINGNTQTCNDYTVLTGSEETLAEGWYVADGTISFDHQLSASDGDIHIILKDGAVMRIGTEESPVNDVGIDAEHGGSISIHGQSTGEHRGQLWINTTGSGIYTYGGNVEISGCEVHAKVNEDHYSTGICSNKQVDKGGSVSMTNAVFTAESKYGIFSGGGGITLTNCKVTATSDFYGIIAEGADVIISGGQVTATGEQGGIVSSNGGITLSWNAPTDFIEASSYSAGTITLDKAFTDGNGNIYSGVIDKEEDDTYAINDKKLLPYDGPLNLTATNITETSAMLTWDAAGEESQWLVSWSTDGGSTWSTPVTVNERSYELTGLSGGTTVRVKVQGILGEGLYSAPATCTFGTPLTYLDINGYTQTCSDYTVLTGSESKLAAGWYVADGTISFDHTLRTSGDIHLILKDGAVMRIGTEQSPVSYYGIDATESYSISIHGQSTGEHRGQLWINAMDRGIDTNGGKVEISGGEVHAKGDIYGIFSSNADVIISGGQVTATGTSYYGIRTSGSITLSWNAPTDFIESNSYSAGTITLAKAFTDGDGNNYIGTVSASAINGKKLLPLPTPLNLTATNITDTSATLTWEAAGEETQWLVSCSTDNGSTWSTSDAVNACSYELTGLSVNTIVRVKVQAILGEGLYSAPAACTFGTPLTYLDINGDTQTCNDYTVLTGSESGLAEGWYVAYGTVSFDHQLYTSGDIHLILKDDAVMRIGTEESPVRSKGIDTNGYSISIHGQSTGERRGQLWINTTSYGIYANDGNVEISGGEVHAKGIAAYGIYVYKRNNKDGSVSMTDATVTAGGKYGGIYSYQGDITLTNCKVTATATDSNGIHANGGKVNICGGQVTATGEQGGIVSSNGGITLSWKAPTDFIEANSYSAGTITLAKAFTDGHGNIYSGVIDKEEDDTYAIDGKKLLPYIPPVNYLDINGYTQTCSDYTVLTGSEKYLAPGWYVADGKVSFDHALEPYGNIHLILKDGAVMRIGTEESPASAGIIANSGHSISIHGQSTGEHRGQLWINTTGYSFYAEHGNSEISCCEVHAKGSHGFDIDGGSLSMTGAVVTAEGTHDKGIYIRNGNLTAQGCSITATTNGLHGIYANNITLTDCKVTATSTYTNGQGIFTEVGNVEISGGQVTATGICGIYAKGNITLSWNAPTDYIYASSYSAGTITLAKAFTDADGNIYSGTVSASDINGRKLLPDNGPLNLTATIITETSAMLTWEAAGEETQWLVSWSTDDGSTWSTPDAVNACSYELTNLSVGTTVRVKVKAIFGEGLYSAPATCTFRTLQTPLTYLDINGTTQTCNDYTVLTGSESSLDPGWYVAEGNVSFDHGLIASDGDIHLILKDGAVMNMNIESDGSLFSGYGILTFGNSISIHGQSTGESKGQLWINATDGGIGASGTITLINCKVTATGAGGILGYDGVNICGGQVTATGEQGGILSPVGITLSWNAPTDFIEASSYSTYEDGTITLAKAFTDGNGNIYSGVIAKEEDDTYAINGKKLLPYIGDANGDNVVTIADAVMVVSYLVNGVVPEGFNFNQADVDGSGTVDATDLRAIVDMILAQP